MFPHTSLLLQLLFDTSSLYGGRERTASWAMVVDRRMVIACWCWMVDVRGAAREPTCAPACPRQNRHQTAAAAEQHHSRAAEEQSSSKAVSSLQHQNQSVLPALLLLYINCHRSCGDIFTQFNSYSHETNLQICATRSICHPSLEFTNIQNGIFHDEMAASNGRYIIHRCNWHFWHWGFSS